MPKLYTVMVTSDRCSPVQSGYIYSGVRQAVYMELGQFRAGYLIDDTYLVPEHMCVVMGVSEDESELRECEDVDAS